MTREELDEHIEYVSHTACGYPPISIMASEVERWLKDIRDNGIEPNIEFVLTIKICRPRYICVLYAVICYLHQRMINFLLTE